MIGKSKWCPLCATSTSLAAERPHARPHLGERRRVRDVGVGDAVHVLRLRIDRDRRAHERRELVDDEPVAHAHRGDLHHLGALDDVRRRLDVDDGEVAERRAGTVAQASSCSALNSASGSPSTGASSARIGSASDGGSGVERDARGIPRGAAGRRAGSPRRGGARSRSCVVRSRASASRRARLTTSG